MPAFAGPVSSRSVAVKRGAAASEVLIAAVRTKSLKINAEPIDVTNDDDSSVRKLLDMPGEQTVEISVAGVAKNHTLLAESLSTTDIVQSTTFEYPGGGKLAGNFAVTSYAETGEYKGAMTFEATFQSAGAVTYTPGA